MSCRRYKPEIVEFARREIEMPDELRVHFERCAKCNNEFKHQRELSGALKNLRESAASLKASKETERTVLAAFHGSRKKESVMNEIWIWRVAAALVCISIGSVLLWRVRQQPFPSRITQNPKQTESREITSGFIPLMHGELTGNSVQMIRVKLPRSSLLDLGFPINVDRPDELIDADVIVGEEGLPHAIRFIQKTNSAIDFQEEK